MDNALGTILCGVDESAPAEAALQVAVPLAHAARSKLVLAHVASAAPAAVHLPASPGVAIGTPAAQLAHGTFMSQQELEGRAARWLAAMAEEAGVPEADQLVVGPGAAADVLAAIARERGAGLLVLGSHGRSAVWDALLGSVTSRLVTGSPVPLLVVPSAVVGSLVPEKWSRQTLVCGFDGSEGSVRAAHAAARLAVAVGAVLRLVCVLDGDAEHGDDGPPTEDELREAASVAVPDGKSLLVERAWARGHAAEELERIADEIGAPAVVVGSRGRGPLRSALLGSISQRLLATARRPVLVVPPAASS